MPKRKAASRTKDALVIFAKSPASASVKTRLQVLLSPQTAGRLAEAFLYDTVETARKLNTASRLFIACSPSRHDPCFQALAREYGITLIDQRGEDIGRRMANAFQDLRKRGYQRILIIGSDLPTLPISHLRQAFRLLRRDQVVIGPSLDGGYYLIGISDRVPPIFDGIPWSSDAVCAMTMGKILKAKLSCGQLPFWYDVDRPEDLRFLGLHLRLLHQGQEPQGRRVAVHTKAVVELIENHGLD